ncbi:MAG: hypothetical protein AAFN77_09815 [Planctomycetota bacterium]
MMTQSLTLANSMTNPIQTKSFALLLLLLLVGFHRCAHGDVVWLKDGQTVYGKIESRDDTKLTIRSGIGDEARSRSILNSEIQLVRVNVDEQRLSELDPASPSAYLEYAEELAAEASDPYAKSLAIRLYLLTANLSHRDSSNEHQGNYRSALIGTLSLESDDRRRQSVRALLLRSTGEIRFAKPEIQVSGVTQADRTLMLKLVKHLRRRESQAAIDLLRKQQMRESALKWASDLTLDELDRLARSTELKPIELNRLLSVELQLLRENRRGRSNNDESDVQGRQSAPKGSESRNRADGLSESWAEQSTAMAKTANRLPTLEELFEQWPEFDFRATRFQNGQWVTK